MNLLHTIISTLSIILSAICCIADKMDLAIYGVLIAIWNQIESSKE